MSNERTRPLSGGFMKSVLIIIVFLLFSHLASAHEAFSCKPISVASRIKLSFVKDLPMKDGKIIVYEEGCSTIQNQRYTDICDIAGHTILISTSESPSVIVLDSGSVHKLNCAVTPGPRAQQQDTRTEAGE